MTADIRHYGEYGGLTVTYSLYCHREKTSETVEGVARYEVVESVKEFVPKRDRFLDLTVFDFFPAEALKEHGLTNPGDLRASIVMFGKVLRGCFIEVSGGLGSKEIETLERLLED